MPRPPTKNPLGVSDQPNLVIDPVRANELKADFSAKLDFVRRHVLLTLEVFDER